MKIKSIIFLAALWVGFFSLPVLETGCAGTSTQVVAVKTLEDVGQAAETTVAISAQLYGTHAITAAQANSIRDFYMLKFQPAFGAAVDAVQGNKQASAPASIIQLSIDLAALLSQAQNHT